MDDCCPVAADMLWMKLISFLRNERMADEGEGMIDVRVCVGEMKRKKKKKKEEGARDIIMAPIAATTTKYVGTD